MGQAQGGIREHLLCLAKFLDRRRFTVSVAGPLDPRTASELLALGLDFVPLPANLSLRSIIALRKTLRRGFDLVHSHGYRATLLASLNSLPNNPTPQICTIHTLLPPDAFQGIRGQGRRQAAAWAMGKCRAIISVSKAVANNIEQHFPRLAGRTQTIYNGVDPEQVRPATMRSYLADVLGFDPNLPVVGTVARLSREKGVHVLLEAAELLTAADVTAEYIIVGDGPERNSLENTVHQLGLTAQVRFMGERRDISQLISLFDILVVPSLSEAFSLVALMGGMLGVTVIATRSGGIEEFLTDELATFVPPGDAKALAQALLTSLEQGQRQPAGFLTSLMEELTASEQTMFSREPSWAASAFTTYDITDDDLPPTHGETSPQAHARRLLMKRFNARRMAEETTLLYESVLGDAGA